MAPSPTSDLGIAAISIDQPSWQLENGWFGATIPRKFTQHTGIEARAISLDDELTMGLRAVRRLQQESGCNLANCRGIVFVSPSFIPPSIARRHLAPHEAARERPRRAARQLARELGLRRCRTLGLNWFCCGYSRAFALITQRWAPRLVLERDDFLLVVVATRISRITDYG
jgi:3-oxoacyl-[acyl-carrier-protein] synthase III